MRMADASGGATSDTKSPPEFQKKCRAGADLADRQAMRQVVRICTCLVVAPGIESASEQK
jgi:hypothetical protein